MGVRSRAVLPDLAWYASSFAAQFVAFLVTFAVLVLWGEAGIPAKGMRGGNMVSVGQIKQMGKDVALGCG